MDMYAFIDELEARFDEARSCDLQELIDELTDAERASVTLSARLAGVEGVVTLALRGGGVIVGEVLDSTSTWVLLRASTGDSLVMISAVVGAWPLGRSVARESSIRGGIGVGHVLRELSARGIEVAIDSDCGDLVAGLLSVLRLLALARRGVLVLDELLQNGLFDSPDVLTANLDGRELAGGYEGAGG